MFERIKPYIEDDALFYGALILVVGIGSFGLGRLSVVLPAETAPASIVVTEAVSRERSGEQVSIDTASAAPTVAAAEAAVVASKNGSKYHFLWCPGANQMKEENKVFFNSIAEAKAAGYAPAANCKGLQ